MQQFQKDIASLVPINVGIANTYLKTNKAATIFLGRATCPYCRLFASKLANVLKHSKETVYFINSEDHSQLTELTAFRQKYDIKTVPAFIRIEDGQLNVICDSSISEDSIKSFGKL